MPNRIGPKRCCGVLIDVQGFFLEQVDARLRAKIVRGTTNFVRLLGHFTIPVMVTLEIPVAKKGSLPQEIKDCLSNPSETFEKDFFDLCREEKITDRLRSLKKKQVILVGCETDVCVLQSCLGLLELGYEVYVVEDLLFSSSVKVDAALARMTAAGATFLTYKTLYYELAQSVQGCGKFPALPDDLHNSADDAPESGAAQASSHTRHA